MNALSGELSHFLPVQILRLLQMTGSTGRLEILRGTERADLFIVAGRPSNAHSTGVHARVGEILVESGEILPEAMELTVALQQDRPGARIGHMLVENGVIEADRLRAAVLEVQRRIVCQVILWQEGEFRFHPGQRASDEDITLNLDLDRLMIVAMQLAQPAPTASADDLAA